MVIVAAADAALQRELERVEVPDAASAVVVAPGPAASWSDAERELTLAFELARQASLQDASVVFLIDADAALGRAAPLDSAVAVGLVSGARCLAFEGNRRDQYAVAIAHGPDVPPAEVADAVQLALTTRTCRGQTMMLGRTHLGAMQP